MNETFFGRYPYLWDGQSNPFRGFSESPGRRVSIPGAVSTAMQLEGKAADRGRLRAAARSDPNVLESSGSTEWGVRQGAFWSGKLGSPAVEEFLTSSPVLTADSETEGPTNSQHATCCIGTGSLIVFRCAHR